MQYLEGFLHLVEECYRLNLLVPTENIFDDEVGVVGGDQVCDLRIFEVIREIVNYRADMLLTQAVYALINDVRGVFLHAKIVKMLDDESRYLLLKIVA